ncbi:hypothetical protein JK182_12360 [Acetobacter okinawensis]|uniref:hypothetical protein n=1 Tax=Acetobacter okinawensis TaxID=1076594 RepID=UPI001BA55163|nr:hypothetical protein [Acetobacter okinawensis]MBS0989448.1 hypothetical protein [Acetobacter okinawensis]
MDETFRNDILYAVPFDGTDALISMPDVLPGTPDIPIKMPSFPVALIEWCEPDQYPQGVMVKAPSFEHPEGIFAPLSGGHLSGKRQERAIKCFRWLAYLLGSTIDPDFILDEENVPKITKNAVKTAHRLRKVASGDDKNKHEIIPSLIRLNITQKKLEDYIASDRLVRDSDAMDRRFHQVREHLRRCASGKIAVIRAHARGNLDFGKTKQRFIIE